MRDVRRGVEQTINPVPAVRPDHRAVVRLGVFLDHVPVFFEQRAGFHVRDGVVETLAGRLDEADGVRVRKGLGADVVGLVQVAVVAAVVDGHVDIEDVAVDQGALIGDSVADYFVHGRADGFGEADVV